jgi:hypothetical protein
VDEAPIAKRTSPWVFVGIGCGVVVLAIVGAAAVGGFMLFRAAKSISTDMMDPKVRVATAERLLGTHQMPDGYRPAVAFSLGPIEMVLLSDREPDANGAIEGFDRRGFLYTSLPQGNDKDALRDFMDGKRDNPGHVQLSMHSRETLGRGSVSANGETIRYVAQRGEFRNQQVTHKGITTTMVIECPDDGRSRMAFWFGPDPDPDTPAKSLDLTGSTADEAAIRELMGHFKPCPSVKSP